MRCASVLASVLLLMLVVVVVRVYVFVCCIQYVPGQVSPTTTTPLCGRLISFVLTVVVIGSVFLWLHHYTVYFHACVFPSNSCDRLFRRRRHRRHRFVCELRSKSGTEVA